MRKIAIIGCGGHTRSSINLLKQYDYNISGIFDDSYDKSKQERIHNLTLLGKVQDIDSRHLVFLSIGNNHNRKQLYKQLKKRLIKKNLFHKTAFIENNLVIGHSNQIYSNVYINSYTKIGNNNIINTRAILEHEVKIGNHNHISVGSKLCGRVKIGNLCMIGAGVIIIDKISICDNVTIGAGSVVIRDITEAGTYIGNPARKIK